MANILNIEFLKLEFKELYNEIIKALDNENKQDSIERFGKIIKTIILIIYKRNKIVFNIHASIEDSIKTLNKINIMPINIMRKILILIEDIDSYLLKPDALDDSDELDMWINENKEDIMEIICWLVVNCGEEDYSLILGGLEPWQRDMFERYINTKKEIVQDSDDELQLISDEDKKILGSKLVERGENYYLGKGVRKNNKEALKYFLKAAKLGDEYAEAYLGLFYEKGIAVKKDDGLAKRWYKRAAIKGNNFAQYSLGVLLSKGNIANKDYEKSLIWLQKSAENEYPPAYYQLGLAYYNGQGVEKDNKKAHKWYTKGAESNFGAAQHALSYLYKTGEGCEKNLTKAYYWVEKAAENDYEDAYYIVGRSYLDGIYFEQNYEKAFYYLTKGYEALDTNCIEALGDMYYKGLHVKKDVFKGIELYNKSIDCGNKSLYFKLGKIYEDKGLIKQAMYTYNSGHLEDDVKCTQRLGVMYYNGEGVQRDLEKAISYMEKAASNKAPHALYVLGVAYLRLNKFGESTAEVSKALLKEAYELKSPFAAEYLAYIMINERREGKDIDEKQLLEYIQFGVENNITDSYFQYGYIYDKAIGVKEDLEKAYFYYNKAAENNSLRAMVKIADWFKRGKFLARDIDLAVEWYEKAAKKNDIDAIEKLIEIYEIGIGGKKSEVKALYYLFKLLDLDAIKGKSKLAYYCLKGIGVEIDENKGKDLIKEVEELDKGSANNLKGFLGEQGLLKLTSEEIIKLYSEGIDLGNSDCYGSLALYLYDKGLYEQENYKELFNTAMTGRELSVKKCNYIYLKQLLKDRKNNSVVTVEEIFIINRLKRLVDRGLYFIVRDLLDWYKDRGKEKEINYYGLKEQAIFYNISLNNN